ncbi:ATP-dependent helicase [Campylobacter upsaliensis]|nr:ATP-dependent helicase [Campylobacter upsaliensis]EAK4235905.1 ATP-dependent helicase [Campylobacter upsaliensis]
MKLSKEQELILEKASTLKQGEILKINACAGSGKTTMLKHIALANPLNSFLYLAFNKAIAQKSKKLFPKNVEVKTIHSLAYVFAKKHLGSFSLLSNLKIFDIAPFFSNQKSSYLNAVLKEYARFLKSDETETSYKEVALLYEAMLKKELPMTHDFYLKYYQLASGGKELHNYDYILFDEAQDSNAVMLSIFLNNVCKKILVGDTFQNIYGFNQTINALETIEADFHLNLSTNYRSTQEILDYADSFLETCSSKNRVKMHSALKEEVKIKTQAFITRTNAGLIELINTLRKEENLDEVALLKEPESIFKLLFDIFSFRANRFELISKENAFLHNFDSMFELRSYASYDAELSLALNLSEKPYDFKALKKLALKLYQNKNANIFLINAHLSKGLEWDRVILHNDFVKLRDLKAKIEEEKNQEEKAKREFEMEQELNLFYVAITRARFELEDRSGNNKEVLRQDKKFNKMQRKF